MREETKLQLRKIYLEHGMIVPSARKPRKPYDGDTYYDKKSGWMKAYNGKRFVNFLKMNLEFANHLWEVFDIKEKK